MEGFSNLNDSAILKNVPPEVEGEVLPKGSARQK